MSANGSAQERFIFLDGLRGVAAFAVALMHAFEVSGVGTLGFGNIGLAVDFFFCLSGFVVAHAYDGAFARGMGFADFMQRRLIRLYPMILVGAVLGGLAALAVAAAPAANILRDTLGAALLLPTGLLANRLAYPLNVPMWSLFFEIAACVGYAVVLTRLNLRSLALLTALVGVALGTVTLIAGQVTNFGVFGVGSFLVGGLRVAYPFALGVLLCRLRWFAAWPKLPPWVGLASLLAVLFMPAAAMPQAVFQAAAVLLMLPLVLMIGTATPVRSNGVWMALGRVSYPLYLIHWPVLIVVTALLKPHVPPLGVAVASVLAAVVVAQVVLVIYDEPVRAWLKRMADGRATAVAKQRLPQG